MTDEGTGGIDPRIAESFARQPFMATLGARLAEASDGRVRIEMPASADLTQQHGFMHAAAIAAIGDSACGYAVMTLAPEGHGVLTVEYKVSLLEPARGDTFSAEARVIRSGRRISFAEAAIHAHAAGDTVLIARLSATIASIDESRRG